MLGSSIVSLLFFVSGFVVYSLLPESAFATVMSPYFWLIVTLLMAGVVVGGIYNIAMPVLVAYLVPEERRDNANGMYGMVNGLGFGITSVASGLMLGYLVMYWVLLTAVVFTILGILALSLVQIREEKTLHAEHAELPKKIDLKGTIRAVNAVPGLMALIIFTTFNNFLGGVFMSLMDAYGLSLVNVQTWGLLWGALSFAFILGGILITKWGVGKNPVATMFRINVLLWTICIFFTIQPWIWLLAVGMVLWLTFMPFVEATEQTIFQKVVPKERLGRVFGFAHSVEQAASPITAFMIGPIAQFIFIPFMTTGAGVELIGDWFGTGTGRGIALVFIVAGVVGLMVTLVAMRTREYRLLGERYLQDL
ncbi:MAG: multidrug resistance protein [Patescibacteria group bacterium]|nr:MAG: multidrug resistance protein [Patescibacteria group bacterium]